ncbi:MAG: tRNA adenosine(34) deaminase TadA [Gammaproteobacteria bacterium]|nr:tRNA adenosine(34) deaminase TadA [Gammaproteobacteria bacterium]
MIDEQRYMQQALNLAKQAAQQGEVPVGAVVVLNDEVIGKGFNQPISCHDPTAHAEIIALRDASQHIANYRLIDADLYVTLEPCAMCAGAMIHARIKRVIFGAHDPKSSAKVVFESALTHKLNHTIACQGGVLQNDCSAIIKNFFQKKR